MAYVVVEHLVKLQRQLRNLELTITSAQKASSWMSWSWGDTGIQELRLSGQHHRGGIAVQKQALANFSVKFWIFIVSWVPFAGTVADYPDLRAFLCWGWFESAYHWEKDVHVNMMLIVGCFLRWTGPSLGLMNYVNKSFLFAYLAPIPKTGIFSMKTSSWMMYLSLSIPGMTVTVQIGVSN